MPLVRAVARAARANGNRFSALVLGVVKSTPFSMNAKVPEAETSVASAFRRKDP